MDLGGSYVEGECDLLAHLVSGCLDPLHQELQCRFVGGQVGGESPLVADVGAQTSTPNHLLQSLIDLGACPQRFGEGGETTGDHHELLDVDRVGGMGPAVEDVETGDGKGSGSRAAQIAVEGQPESGCRRP